MKLQLSTTKISSLEIAECKKFKIFQWKSQSHSQCASTAVFIFPSRLKTVHLLTQHSNHMPASSFLMRFARNSSHFSERSHFKHGDGAFIFLF